MDYISVEKIVLNAKKIIDKHINLKVNKKAENDFVTDVDIEISRYIKNELGKLFPEVGFFSEEEPGKLNENCWILDPIDGTTNLVYGYKLSSISLAHYKDGIIRYGIVYNPFYDEIFTAEYGKGSFLNHTKKLHVSDRPLSESLVEFGAGSTHKENTDENFELVKLIFKNCVDVRRICSSALDICYIADGRIDGYFEKILKPWDYAAGMLILSEAGGVACDYNGGPIQYSEASSIIAGNNISQPALVKIIMDYYKL